MLLVKARLSAGLTLSHDVKAAHATDLYSASASHSGAGLSGKWGDTVTLTLRVVSTGFATIRGGANAPISANQDSLDLTALRGAFVPRLCREALDPGLEHGLTSAPEAREKHYGSDEIVSEHV